MAENPSVAAITLVGEKYTGQQKYEQRNDHYTATAAKTDDNGCQLDWEKHSQQTPEQGKPADKCQQHRPIRRRLILNAHDGQPAMNRRTPDTRISAGSPLN
jgi:hypothetical protein